ncbi:hypothetical protein Pint_15061 [Pistacia integerrima]|uniref:Uncharacterized protein n=1 Tax=Pistacia integerrima TaxID=434235 RepID=A0ACC0ZCA2_9ROSI|nr:hypothetical protein Pint_15061 [Pistacia integerrima]
MGSTKLILVLFCLLLIISSSSAAHKKKIQARKPCRRLVFYFHDIIYNGKNTECNFSHCKCTSLGQQRSHFGDVVVFDDPITLDNNLHSTPIGRAQGFYLYDKKETFTAWLVFSFVFNSTAHKSSLNFAGADPLMNKTRDISVIGGTGDFFMARGIATLRTDAFEGEVYFRLCVDIKLSKCW